MKEGFQTLSLDHLFGEETYERLEVAETEPDCFPFAGCLRGERKALGGPREPDVMRFTKQSRPPRRQRPACGFKHSQKRKAQPLPKCLMELPPHVPSTSFQSRCLLANFSWRKSSQKQGMFFLDIF